MEGRVVSIDEGKALVQIGGASRRFDAPAGIEPGDLVVVREGRVQKKHTADVRSLETKTWSA